MNKLTKPIALFACLALVLGFLPGPAAAADTVSGADLRAGTVERVEAIMDVDWTLQTRQAKANITGELLDNYKAGGILPTTYFEYKRLQFNYKGVIVEDVPATLEEFAAMASMDASVVPGIPHNIYANAELKGMDINSFLTDISSRVMSEPLTGLRQALTHPELTALAEGANLSAASSKAAIGAQAAKAGYAKLGKGDLLLAWDNAATGVEGGGPRIHALVVKEVNGQQVTVMYPAFSLLLWYFKCDTCGVVETEGPTSAALPGHVHSLGYNFGSFMEHAGCGGTWAPLYATTWRTETVSFDQLYGDNGTVPHAGTGYLPYSFKAYADGTNAAQVKVTSDFNSDNYLLGFTAKITSDHRITSVKAVITRGGQEVCSVENAPALGSKEYTFTNKELNEALRICPGGSTNTVTLYTRSGPLTGADLADGAYRKAASYEFSVGQDTVKLVGDKTNLEQGEQLRVSVVTLTDGITGLRANVSYDPKSYVFEPEATRAANPGLTITEQEGVVTVERYGTGLSSNATAATLIFHAKRTGAFPVDAKDNGQIFCSGSFVSTKEGAGAADLKAAKPSADIIRTSVGYNTIVYKDFAAGQDLLLLFTATEEQKLNQTDSSLMMTYNGFAMLDVTSLRYETGEGDIQRIYAVITEKADPGKIGTGNTACVEIAATADVNGSGALDISDLQTAANIMNGKLPLTGNEAKWLLADADRNGKVDDRDLAVLWAKLAG